MNNWRIEYDNDTGPDDGGYREWWTVTNDEKSFKCDSIEDAEWLLSILANYREDCNNGYCKTDPAIHAEFRSRLQMAGKA